jgi:lipopolysaccharide transport system permease protein
MDWLIQPFRTLYRNRGLAWQFCLRVVLQRTRGSFFGVLWQLFIPLFMMSLYTLVFGVLFQGSFNRDNPENPLLYGIGIYLGLSLLGLLNDTIGQAPFSIVGSPNLVKKVVFPLEILPLSSAAFPLGQTIAGLLLGGIALSFLGHPPGLDWLWIPVLVAPVLLTSVGLAWLVGSLSVYFRDLSHFMSVVTQVLFWSSGIFYAVHTVQEYPVIWNILKWNPMLLVIEEVRNIMIWSIAPTPRRVLYLYAVGLVCWYAGFHAMARLRKGFADVL